MRNRRTHGYPLKFFTQCLPGRRTRAQNVTQDVFLRSTGQNGSVCVQDDFQSPEDRDFSSRYPAYALTAPLDDLRSEDFSSLNQPGCEIYADWMGSAVFAGSLVRKHASLLVDQGLVFGNPHSRSKSSQLSSEYADAARAEVLRFFDASPDEYAVIFTANASAALKLVGEAYPFAPQRSQALILCVDSHNSVHGLRRFAERCGADVRYIAPGRCGGVDWSSLQECLISAPQDESCLLVLTGQSNVTSAKAPLADILRLTRERSIHVLLDAAALAPTSKISLRETPVDAMAVSFYKMFGYPTGVGALVARKEFLHHLKRPWFAGGTVDVVQVPGSGSKSYTFEEGVGQWEDGTVNFLSLAAIKEGLALLESYRDILPLRLSILSHYMDTALRKLVHSTGKPMVQILSVPPTALSAPGQVATSGAVCSFIMLDSQGRPIKNDKVESMAQGRVALRAGCHCNPGAVMFLLHDSGFFSGQDGIPDPLSWMNSIHEQPEMATKNAVSNALFDGDESFGVLRISLGMGSNLEDVRAIVRWVDEVAQK